MLMIFSTDASVEINDKQQNKTLINASVLGIDFLEKKSMVIKDGSFYTPWYHYHVYV